MRTARGWIVVVVCLASLGGWPGTSAAKRKGRFVARVAGKALRIPPKTLGATTNGLGGIVVAGTKVSRHGRSVSSRTLSIACFVPGLAAGMTLPVTVPCVGAYDVQSGLSLKAWATDNGISLTVTGFDGTRLVGTFAGQIEQPGSTNPTDGPVSVQNGKVAVDLQAG